MKVNVFDLTDLILNCALSNMYFSLGVADCKYDW